MAGYPGPTANLKARHRRSGRAGTVWIEGKMRGEIAGCEWDVEVEQIPVPIPGAWSDGIKPGAEGRRGTFRYHDVDDHWRRWVYLWLDARKRRDRDTAAQFPEFTIVTQIDDIGAPAKTRWALRGCTLFTYSGGFSQDDNLLIRDVPFTFTDDEPLDSFEYSGGGAVTTY